MTITFLWNEKYSVGVEELDVQHKQVIKTLASLNDAIRTNFTKNDMMVIFKELRQYIENHFKAEEKYFKQFNYEFADEHIEKHQEFKEKIAKMEEQYEGDKAGVSFELIDFLEDWLLDHILTTDRKYIECFAKNGLK